MTAQPKTAPLQILFPGPDCWELWSVDAAGITAEFLSISGFKGPASRRVMALPVDSTYAIPLWVIAKNDAELRGAAELHLERDGLNRAGESSGFDVERILEQNSRVLIRVDALAKSELNLSDDSLPPDLICLSPRLLPLPDGQIVVWKELGRFVSAVTRRGKLVYHNVISSPQFDAKAAEEVVRWAKQFQFQGIIEPLLGITAWVDGVDVAAVKAKTGLPVTVARRPTPRFDEAAISAIVPRFVLDLRNREARKIRTRRLLAAGAALAGVAILAFFVIMIISMQRQRALLDRIAALSPAASEIEQIQLRWSEVAAAVDPDQSPLEMLLLIHELPSAREISLTRFERSGDRLSLRGKATSPSEALKFLGAISKSERLSLYRWTYAQPLISQDGTATFDLEGTLDGGTR